MRPLLCLTALCLAACAAPAARVPPVEVSQSTYSALSCPGLISRSGQMSDQVLDLTRKQDNAARADAGALGLLLFPPTLLTLVATPDHSEALAMAKGQQAALSRQIAAKSCRLQA